jgi:hypothetical protein
MKDYTLSGRQANLYGLLFAIPVLFLVGVPYILIWCETGLGFPDKLFSVIYQNQAIIQQAIDAKWWLLLLLLAGIFLHELIHGVCMAAFTKNGWQSVSFGFNVQAFAPYAHCKEPLHPDAYRLTLVMPGFLLGDVPVLIGWFSGNILFLLFGILFCWAAAGDVVVLWLSRKITGGMLQDHPDKIGFVHINIRDYIN